MDIWTFQTLSFYSFRTWKLQFFRSIESREPIALHFRFTNQVDFDWDFTGTCDRGCSSICSSWPSNDHVRGTVWHSLAQFGTVWTFNMFQIWPCLLVSRECNETCAFRYLQSMVSAVSAFGMPGMYGAMGYPGLIADVMHDLALCHELKFR